MPRRSRPSGRPSTTSRRTSKARTLRELIAALPAERAAAVFTHSSWAADRTESYERLEFLGDSVLELAIARTLYDRFPEFSEGRMAKVRSETAASGGVGVVSVGVGGGRVAGVVRGVLTGGTRLAFNLLDAWVVALYSVPSVARGPLSAVAFRYQGEAPRIATVVLFAIFPILINTQQGVRNVDRGLLEVARAFSSSERRLWRDVVVPSALPFILAGVRLAIGRALIGMIISEFLVGLRGLGYLIIVYQNTFRIDKMFVPVIVVAIIGILLMGTVQIIEARVAPWTRRET